MGAEITDALIVEWAAGTCRSCFACAQKLFGRGRAHVCPRMALCVVVWHHACNDDADAHVGGVPLALNHTCH